MGMYHRARVVLKEEEIPPSLDIGTTLLAKRVNITEGGFVELFEDNIMLPPGAIEYIEYEIEHSAFEDDDEEEEEQ